jgi:tRNA modification GTPase
LIEEIASTIASPGNSPAITQVRYRINIEKALAHLKRFNLQNELVLAAEDIRLAIRGLEFIIGKVDVDEILGEIFSSFCIGK